MLTTLLSMCMEQMTGLLSEEFDFGFEVVEEPPHLLILEPVELSLGFTRHGSKGFQTSKNIVPSKLRP